MGLALKWITRTNSLRHVKRKMLSLGESYRPRHYNSSL